MFLSVVVVNWNSTDMLRTLADSLRETAAEVEHETIVVDNNSEDFDEASFKTDYPEIKVIAEKENLGYAAGNNVGIKASKGKYILLLNPDIVLKPKAVEYTLRYMEENPNTAAAAVKLVKPEGSVDMSLRSFPYPLGVFSSTPARRNSFRKADFSLPTA